MPSFTSFFNTISKLLPSPSPQVEEAISRLNPDKIYLENVRSVLGVSREQACRICETAVRQGLFQRAVEVLCPDGVVAASAPSESELPKTVRCWIEEDGCEAEMATAGLKKIPFYRLNG